MRCYDGCPDSKLQALIDERERLRKQLSAYDARCVYFPVEQAYQVWQGLHPVTSRMYSTASIAMRAAIEKLANHG